MAETKRSNSRGRGSSTKLDTANHTGELSSDFELFGQAVEMYNKSHPGDDVEVVRCRIEKGDVLTFSMAFNKISSVLELNWKLSTNLEANSFELAIEGDRLHASTPYSNWIGPRKRSANKYALAAWVVLLALFVGWLLFSL